MVTHVPIVHTIGSAFIGRIAKRNAAKISELHERLREDELAVLARFETHETRIAEAIALIGQREQRFEEQLRQVACVSRAFVAGIEELIDEW